MRSRIGFGPRRLKQDATTDEAKFHKAKHKGLIYEISVFFLQLLKRRASGEGAVSSARGETPKSALF